MLVLLLARHGETADNARRVFQGQGGVGLNELGRSQAARLGARLRRSPPAAIVASDLERAEETARIVAAACGAPVELERGLREIDVGQWTGKTYDQIAELFPEEWAAWEGGRDVRRGGGETSAELADRIDRAIATIADRHRETKGPLLLVSHGGSIRSWIGRVLGLPPDGLRVLGAVSNTGLTSVERDRRGRHRLLSWNDIAHLEGRQAPGEKSVPKPCERPAEKSTE
jgi:broad specificity phosphatase PhoE